jgi:putative transcriptional regulator
VLHSSDFFLRSATLPIADGVCLTATLEILRAIADGRGPDRALLALGYAGWAPGSLSTKSSRMAGCTARPTGRSCSTTMWTAKYDRALAKIGVEPAMLSMEAGHA